MVGQDTKTNSAVNANIEQIFLNNNVLHTKLPRSKRMMARCLKNDKIFLRMINASWNCTAESSNNNFLVALIIAT